MGKKYKAILYDMDGTLVPMDMKEFTDGYFKLLAKRLAPYGKHSGNSSISLPESRISP